MWVVLLRLENKPKTRCVYTAYNKDVHLANMHIKLSDLVTAQWQN